MIFTGLIDRLHNRDPEHDGLRRALRAAIVLPIAAAVGFAIAPNTYTPVIAIIGSIALLIAVDFPGTVGPRAMAYCGLALNGFILITLGTLAAPHPWVAVSLCFVVGAVVSFLSLLSEVTAAGQRATLMLFILPVCLRPPGPLGDRLLGWVIALVICVPAALFLFPPRYNSELRRQATRVCAALADRIEGTVSEAEVSSAMDALRAGFVRGAVARPVPMTAGSRSLVRVVSNLQWLCDRVGPDTRALLSPLTGASTRVLRACAAVLGAEGRDAQLAAQAELDAAATDHRNLAMDRYRYDIDEILALPDDETAVEHGRTLLARRAFGFTIGLTGRIIAGAAMADSRPLWARIVGARLPETGFADRVQTKRAALASLAGYLSTGSVTTQMSIRTGLSLAVALGVTWVMPIQNAPWVVLGALSVLRSSALTTGSTALRAITGTVIGFVIGASVIAVLGVDPVVLWTLLPVVAFGSTYVSVVGSFVAGQAMFTMMVLIVFNLMSPQGWQVGLIRIEDVVVGAAVGMIVSALLWPRGAATAVRRAIEAAVDSGSHYLAAAVHRVTRGESEQADDEVAALSQESLKDARSHGDAVRTYLSENAGAIDSELLDDGNRIPRLRIAADLIADLTPPPVTAFPRAREVLDAHTAALCARIAGDEDAPVLPAISDDFVPALRAEADHGELAAHAALPLVTTAANLGELELTYPAEPVVAVEPAVR